ncbi:hypothetical protein [Candidatus Methanoperedens nitratireducens]|uniref:Uncharacterized protein n=1 Tax=Candidatus Methanoperedens nitratireducens TaxID=1392998 RepID=A0A284VSN2_9EURY|nr:hypothetical protein [Candidatus Methanoperedens nitroreducens]SNQ62291.1 hypothetical protein MNV_660029 [Candidatus Methanoperedens nitroreducens]
MDKKRVVKLAKIAVVVLLVFSVSGYYLYQHAVEYGLAKPALLLKVSMNLTSKGTPMVNNVTFEQSSVPFFYKRVDSVPDFPEIDANARINTINAAPASYWASQHVKFDEEGVYTLRLFFRDGSEPKQGDLLIMPIRVVSRTGTVAYKTTAFWQWE